MILKTPNENIEISRVTEVDVKKKFIHLDELNDGSFRLTYTKGIFKNTKDINMIEIERKK